MKKLIILALAALAGGAAAQNDSGTRTNSPGPQMVPAPNINTGGNPTAPAQLPTTATGNPQAPTYPAGTDKPAWTGGTIAAPAPKASDARDEKLKAEQRERERATQAPQQNTDAAPPPPATELVSPQK